MKIGFSVAILYWLFINGKLDFSLLAKSAQNPSLLVCAFTLIICQNIINAMRWLQILQTQTKNAISRVTVIFLNWIGLFFNTVLPGVVTGDLVKMFYLRGVDSKLTKTSMLLSVLIDRVFGLIALMLLMGIISSFRYNELISMNENIRTILMVNFSILFAVFVGLITLFLPKKAQKKLTNLWGKIPIIGDKINHLNECFWLIANDKKTLFKCLGISFISHSLGIIAFYILTSPFYSTNISLIDLFTFIPIGFVITAIPISPGGMGVGHIAFDQLFGYFNVDSGASLFNIFWIVMMANNLLGLIPYLIISKIQGKAPINELNDEQI